jgi:hypothetical protein
MIQMAESVRASELNDGEAAAAHVRDNRGEVGCVSASASLTDLENNPGNELSAQWLGGGLMNVGRGSKPCTMRGMECIGI